MKKMNGALKGFLIFIAIVVVLGMAVFAYYRIEVGGIFRRSEDVDIEVAKGSGSSSIANALEANGVIGNKYLFRLYLSGKETNFQYGTFTLNPHSSYDEIIEQLETMQVVMNTATLTIPEGTETREIVQKLVDLGVGTEEEIKNVINTYDFDFPLLDKLPTGNEYRLEGYLFPDTYEIYTTNSTENIAAIFTKMLDNFEAKTANLRTEVDSNGGDFIQTITLASIIEREGQKTSELPIVSSVFHNRIDQGMKLESCATVQYVLEERKEVLSIEDTNIDSPYNTYLNAGLTPGPIANPGLAAIRAAIYPDDTEYLFFVARYDGSHLFAKTYAEHEANIVQSSKEAQEHAANSEG